MHKVLTSKKIKMCRKNLNLTLDQLANKIGSSKSYVWELENKPLARPSAEIIFKLADALNITADYLMDDTTYELLPEHKDQAIFARYRKLDEPHKEILRKLFNAYCELYK